MTMLCVVVGLATELQTARADFTRKDSADFNWKYEMTTTPDAQDIDGVAGNDFVYWWNDGAWNSGAFQGTINGDGTVTMWQSGANTFQSKAATEGNVWSDVAAQAANGFTVEGRLKTTKDPNADAGFSMGGCASANQFGGLILTDTGVYWGQSWVSGATPLATGLDNSSDYHVYRMAKVGGENSFSVWRDGALLGSGLASVLESSDNLFNFGEITSVHYGTNQIDYLRIATGAYAPVPEPATAMIVTTGAIGILAYAWRRRK
jgi:hypothetical protein